ncbi:lipopolysaccharide biosynthesis protein [Chroococcidiopsis sp. FACHB-1243]|uniref:lipopolysaccharide biosynthesis protein n=1 Tax=Chroococcidiopsis sp. [FACHB-1243] TaxID=2692781 RepID=UPI00178391ED|nr:lipopolysaccharide biosynthesis protein [Chroococcidiopsis sp. [FACHB-1243]]MBD2309512.1 lipopolysaccharide biosynthesis protein [Chroococcidiopsis sp. [FACHB-1243]]
MMDIRQKVVKGVVWSVIQHWGSQTISFAVFSLLARLLKPEEFGLVALASVFIALMEIFLDQGLSQAIVQRQQLEPEHLDSAFWANLTVGILLTICSIIFAKPIANLFNRQQLAPILQWLSLSFLLNSFSCVQQAIFHRELAFKFVAARSLLATLGAGTIGITMAVGGFGVWSLVGQKLAGALVGAVVLWSASDWRPRFCISVKHFQELFAFGINAIGLNAINFFNRRTDDFLIGYFLGPVALGYYTIAYRVLLVMTQLLITVTNQVALPTFSKLQAEPERLQRAFYTVTQLTSLVAFPTFIGMAVLAPEVVQILFGSQWRSSIPIMQVLAFVGILHSMLNFNSTVMMAKGKPAWKLGINCLTAVVNILGFVLVIRWGVVAVALAYVIGSYLTFPISIYVVRQLISLQSIAYLRQYAIAIAATSVMVSAILAAKYFLHGLLFLPVSLAIYTLIGAIFYALTIFILAPKLFGDILSFMR